MRAFNRTKPVRGLAAAVLLAGVTLSGLAIGGCAGPSRRAEFFEIRGMRHASRAVADPLGDADIALLWPDLIERPAGPSTAYAGAE